MDIQKRRTFIISFIYFGIIGVLCYIGLKKLLPILIPFMAAMAIAAMLEPAVSLLDRHMKGGKGAAAAVVLLVFYGSILTIMCVSGSQILSSIQEQAKKLPGIYSQTIEPGLSHFFSLLENSFPGHSIHISALICNLPCGIEIKTSSICTVHGKCFCGHLLRTAWVGRFCHKRYSCPGP